MSPFSLLAEEERLRDQYGAACASTRGNISSSTLTGFLEVHRRMDEIQKKMEAIKSPERRKN